MNLVFGKVEEENMLDAYIRYYEYYCRMVGESIFSRNIRKNLANGNISENVFYLADEAYRLTKETISNSLYGEGPTILMTTQENGWLGFYFRMKDYQENGTRTITIGELVGKYPFNRTEYAAYIAYLEPHLIEAFPDLTAIDFEVPNTDEEYMIAVLDAGYAPSEPNDIVQAGNKGQKFYTTMYEKKVLEQKETTR